MNGLGREPEQYYQRRKQGAQRTLALERQAIIERAEGFVHQLQCDLSRLDTALANMDVLLAEVTRTPSRWLSLADRPSRTSLTAGAIWCSPHG